MMETKFFDSKGFNYLHFLEELQPSEELEDKYQLRMTQLTAKKEQVGVEYAISYLVYSVNCFCYTCMFTNNNLVYSENYHV